MWKKRYRDLLEDRKATKTLRTVNLPAEIRNREIPNETQKRYLLNELSR